METNSEIIVKMVCCLIYFPNKICFVCSWEFLIPEEEFKNLERLLNGGNYNVLRNTVKGIKVKYQLNEFLSRYDTLIVKQFFYLYCEGFQTLFSSNKVERIQIKFVGIFHRQINRGKSFLFYMVDYQGEGSLRHFCLESHTDVPSAHCCQRTPLTFWVNWEHWVSLSV